MAKDFFILGKWAWQELDPEHRYIEFRLNGDDIDLLLYSDGEELLLKSLKISGAEKDDQWKLFRNNWMSRDGKKCFGFESQFSTEGGEPGVFVNVTVFEELDVNRMKQLLMGYSFNREEEKWEHFQREDLLIRLPKDYTSTSRKVQ